MNATKSKVGTRSIETQLEIDAPVEAVWKALTDAEELIRWFPMSAEVKPGVGGSIRSSWRGEDYQSENLIEIWEPNRHLRTTWEHGGGSGGAPLAVDYYLETEEGKTVLRLVHSGFSAAAEWDDMYDGTCRGWAFELRGLRHYLELHRGTPRLVAWARTKIVIPLEEAWERMMSSDGLLRSGRLNGPGEGDRYSIEAATGDKFEGVACVFNPPKDFAGTVENMNDSYLRIRVDRSCGSGGGCEVNLWMSTYGIQQSQVDAFEKRWVQRLNELYPEVAA